MTGQHQGTAVKAPPAAVSEWSYPGLADRVRKARSDVGLAVLGCPAAGDVVLVVSELAANAVLHSRSGLPGGRFSVRVFVYAGEYVWAEVIDQGGPWAAVDRGAERGRGLELVAALAGRGNWGIEGGPACRVAWVRAEWRRR